MQGRCHASGMRRPPDPAKLQAGAQRQTFSQGSSTDVVRALDLLPTSTGGGGAGPNSMAFSYTTDCSAPDPGRSQQQWGMPSTPSGPQGQFQQQGAALQPRAQQSYLGGVGQMEQQQQQQGAASQQRAQQGYLGGASQMEFATPPSQEVGVPSSLPSITRLSFKNNSLTSPYAGNAGFQGTVASFQGSASNNSVNSFTSPSNNASVQGSTSWMDEAEALNFFGQTNLLATFNVLDRLIPQIIRDQRALLLSRAPPETVHDGILEFLNAVLYSANDVEGVLSVVPPAVTCNMVHGLRASLRSGRFGSVKASLKLLLRITQAQAGCIALVDGDPDGLLLEDLLCASDNMEGGYEACTDVIKAISRLLLAKAERLPTPRREADLVWLEKLCCVLRTASLRIPSLSEEAALEVLGGGWCLVFAAPIAYMPMCFPYQDAQVLLAQRGEDHKISPNLRSAYAAAFQMYLDRLTSASLI